MGAFGVALAWDYQRGRIGQNMRKRAAMFRECLTDLGPAFVKVSTLFQGTPRVHTTTTTTLRTRLQVEMSNEYKRVTRTISASANA